MPLSPAFAIILLFGFIVHHTWHPTHEDASNSDGVVHSEAHHLQPTFSPALWIYFVPAQITHLPAIILSVVLSSAVESSAAIALLCVAVFATVGHTLEKNEISSSSSSSSSFAQLLLRTFSTSHLVFLLVSFVFAATTSAMAHSTADRVRIGQAFFGPLAFTAGMSVVAWCKLGETMSFVPSGIISSGRNNNNWAQMRFLPFYLVCVAALYDLFVADIPPTQSEMLIGLATRGALFPGVLAAMFTTWFYLRFIERTTSVAVVSPTTTAAPAAATSSSAGVSTSNGNPQAMFAFHMCCPVPLLSDSLLLPLGTFLFSTLVRGCTSYGDKVEARWSEFTKAGGSSGNWNDIIISSVSSAATGGFADSNKALPPAGTTVVDVGGASAPRGSSPLLPPLPGTTSADADRRRELAMTALQRRLDAKQQQQQQQPQPRPLTPPTVAEGSSSGGADMGSMDLSGSVRAINISSEDGQS